MAQVVEEPSPNYETRKAIKELVLTKGTKVKTPKSFFRNWEFNVSAFPAPGSCFQQVVE